MNSQSRGVIALVSILIVILSLRLIMNPQTFDDRQTNPAPRANELADRIDPNTATAAELSAIPDLGPRRAQAIVDFRQKFIQRHPNELPFHRATDLEQIPGIGPATIENLAPYLQFPPAPK
jgi:competence ComEA-like helix-hairpin-helix protein